MNIYLWGMLITMIAYVGVGDARGFVELANLTIVI